MCSFECILAIMCGKQEALNSGCSVEPGRGVLVHVFVSSRLKICILVSVDRAKNPQDIVKTHVHVYTTLMPVVWHVPTAGSGVEGE